jgi:hypothetical protein
MGLWASRDRGAANLIGKSDDNLSDAVRRLLPTSCPSHDTL